MPQFSLTNLFGITLRESANDGSDFTNADADYRRVFLGEDGELHTRDSAGTVATLGGAASVTAHTGDASDAHDASAISVLDTANNFTGTEVEAALAELATSVSSGVPGGTSFPGSPATDAIFYRTDRDLLYFYDGTRWLTINEYELPQTCRAVFGTGISATATIANLPARQDYDIYVTRFEATPFANSGGTALSGSHMWVSTLDKLAADNTPTTIGTLSLNSGNSAEWQKKASALTEVVTTAGTVLFRIIATKTGTPGSLICSYRVLYRLIG